MVLSSDVGMGGVVGGSDAKADKDASEGSGGSGPRGTVGSEEGSVGAGSGVPAFSTTKTIGSLKAMPSLRSSGSESSRRKSNTISANLKMPLAYPVFGVYSRHYMSERIVVALRISKEAQERLDRVAAVMTQRAEGATVSRSEAGRTVLERGLLEVEKALGIKS